MKKLKKQKMSPKICFVSSSGGHFEQLMMLKPLMDRFDSFIVTEKTSYVLKIDDIKKFYLKQVNRKEFLFVPKMIVNFILSIWILLNEKPDYIISLGVLATIPICLIAKLINKKVIYIESFAKVNTSTLTGRLLYKFADRFYVQWEDMLDIFPNAIFKGGIY